MSLAADEPPTPLTSALPRHTAVRYVTALREGGSLPALMEMDDLSLWVVKFRGAGQGPRALVAELVVGTIARRLGLPVPDLALVRLEPGAERFNRHEEISDLLRASVGLNVGLAHLEGAFNYELLDGADLVDEDLAAAVVWLDALTMNIDRSPRNPNIMIHRRRPWLIDHGAALYFHHRWAGADSPSAQRPFAAIADHVLLPLAGDILAADARLAPLLDRAALEAVLALVPDDLLSPATDGAAPDFESAADNRAAYVSYLLERLSAPRAFAAHAEEQRHAQSGARALPLSHRR